MTKPSLSNRIASALNGSAPSSDEVAGLIQDVEQCLDNTIEALTAERLRLVDPHNSDYQQTQKMVETLGIEQARLEAAHPRLQELLQTAEHHEHCTEWNADYAMVRKERDRLAKELIELYPTMVEKFLDLFTRIAACDKNVDIINRTAPAGEKRRLIGVELTARELDHFTAIQPSLAKEVRLPHPGETCQLAWPPADYSFGLAAADMVYNAMASRSAMYSPDWAEAKKLDDAKKLADWERRNELLKEQQEAAKREYQKAQQRAARGER